MLKALFFLFIGILLNRSFLAYPNFIGHGYSACLTCHYNPYGNGPLNDYGRAVSAVAISGRWFAPGTSDEELGKSSNFLMGKGDLPKWFKPSANYRGLFLRTNPGRETEESQWINMMANVNAVMRLGEKDKYIIVASAGYAPKPLSDENGIHKTYRSREHYLGLRPNTNMGAYIGLMDKVYGIRHPDHIAYGRILTENTMNDQTYAIMGHFNYGRFETGLQYFFGNLTQDAALRQKGYSFKGEFLVDSETKVGLSLLSSASTFLENFNYALHMKKGFGKGFSLMMELGQANKTAPLRNSEFASRYAFIQSHFMLARGLYYMTTVEYMMPDTELTDYVMRVSPGFQFFPMQRLEGRVEVTNTRNFSETSVVQDRWTIMGQLHLWF